MDSVRTDEPYSVRERLEQALAGRTIDQPVYAAYDWFIDNRSIDWASLISLGLGRINHASPVSRERVNVQFVETKSEVDGQLRRDVRWITDVGELHEWFLGEWRQEYPIKTSADYRIMARALSDARVAPAPDYFQKSEESLGNRGVTLGSLGRTPLQEIQIDFAGLERFSIDLVDERPELMDLIELMTDLKLREFQAAAAISVKYIKLWENLTIETMGPRIFRQFLVPLYRQISRILARSGQKLLVHYDGKLRLIAEDVASLPFDGLDSLTPPPEGDVTIAEARQFWPDLFFWLHPPLGWFRLPESELIRRVRAMIREAGPTRHCLLLSEEVPTHWQERLPAILRMLNDA